MRASACRRADRTPRAPAAASPPRSGRRRLPPARDRACREERAQREFARLARRAPALDRAAHDRSEHDRTAVRAEFNDVLARVRVRSSNRRPRRRHGSRRREASPRPASRQRGASGLERTPRGPDGPAMSSGARTADPDDADAAAAGRSGEGNDGVVRGEHTDATLATETARGSGLVERLRLLTEMITVFMNASPMLSDVTVGSSATPGGRCGVHRG